MCGIFGVVTGKKRSLKAADFLKDGFIASQVRGTDSSGLAVIDTMIKNKLANYHKLPVCGSMFITDRATEALLAESMDQYTISIGHVRAATQGKIGLSNAHPFIIESSRGRYDRELIGVHNGTLDGWRSHKDAKMYDVDSEWALGQIYDDGIDAFRTFKGAYAFVWWDSSDDQVLNIALNDKRTIFIATSEDGDLLYASEAGMLYWLAERNSIKIDGHVVQLLADHHYKFEAGDVKNFERSPLPKQAAVVSAVNYPARTSYSEKTVMERMDEVLGKYLGAGQDNVTPVPTLLRKEWENAKQLGLNNSRGVFTPTMYTDNGSTVMGTIKLENGDSLMAQIRKAEKLLWDTGETWAVSVIGVQDGDNIIAVCSKPRVTAPQLEAANG